MGMAQYGPGIKRLCDPKMTNAEVYEVETTGEEYAKARAREVASGFGRTVKTVRKTGDSYIIMVCGEETSENSAI